MPEKEKQVYNFNGTTTIVNTYEYDHARRLIKEYQNINDKGNIAIAEYTYDNLGRQKTVKQGSGETVTTDYNIRGWIERVAAGKFAYALAYNNNGNIASQK